MNRLQIMIDKVGAALTLVACLIMIATMLHICADVGGKYLFNRPLPATLDIVETYYMVALVFLPFTYVMRGEGHIAVEMFTRGIGGRGAVALDILCDATVLVFVGAIAWKTGEMAVFKTSLGEIREGGTTIITIWPTRWYPVLGCTVMALALVLRLIRNVGNLVDHA